MNKIKTYKEYKAALKRIEKLLDDSNELDKLIDLVVAYEKIHYPIDPPSKEEKIKFRKEQEGLI